MYVALTQDEAREVVAAIDMARTATQYKRQVRGDYQPPLPRDTEQYIRDEEDRQLKILRDLRNKITQRIRADALLVGGAES